MSFVAGFSAAIAAAALAVSAYLAYFFPALEAGHPGATVLSFGFLTIQLGGAQLLACVLVIVFTVLNLFGVSEVAKLQNFLTGTKIVVICSFLLLGFSVGEGDWGHFSQAAQRTSTHGILAQLAISLVFVYYSYSGWNAAVMWPRRLRSPQDAAHRAGVRNLAVTVLFFRAELFVYLRHAAGGDEGCHSCRLLGRRQPVRAAHGGLFQRRDGCVSSGHGQRHVHDRPASLYAMAKDRAFFASAAKIHPRWKSPWVAVIYQGGCCCLLILTGTFKSLVLYIGFTLWLFSALSVMALLKFRKRPGWERTPWVSFAYPLLPALYVAVNLWIFVYFAAGSGREALWSLLTILGGALVYQFYIRKRAAS